MCGERSGVTEIDDKSVQGKPVSIPNLKPASVVVAKHCNARRFFVEKKIAVCRSRRCRAGSLYQGVSRPDFVRAESHIFAFWAKGSGTKYGRSIPGRVPAVSTTQLLFWVDYSWRSAISGSTCAARRAGSQQATIAVSNSTPMIEPNSSGSALRTPKSCSANWRCHVPEP